MKMLPLQMVIIDMENGQRGVFIGRPLVTTETQSADCQVENVWFTDIHELPDDATLAQLAKMTFEEVQGNASRTLQ
jgi:hypothetical protein